MNILIKLTCLIGLVVAPILGGHTSEDHSTTNNIEKSISIDLDDEINPLEEV